MTTLNDGLTLLGGDSIAESIAVKGELSLKGGSLRVKAVIILP